MTRPEALTKFDELVKQLAEDMPNATIREWMQELERRNKWRRVAVS